MSIISICTSMALIFGAMHALEPGHGKTAIITYMASEKRSWKDGIVISLSSAITHSIAILIIAFVSHVFFHHLSIEENVNNIHSILEVISGLIICLTGIWYLITSKRKVLKSSCCCSFQTKIKKN